MPDEIVYATREAAYAQRQVAIATLAAGIIQARGATNVAGIQQAYEDARHIVDPRRSTKQYQEWVRAHGIDAAILAAAE